MNALTAQNWKVMVIPPLREAANLDMIDACIADEGPNETIFLGNYFHVMADDRAGVESARRMARWLKRSVSQPRRIHLIGEGDLAYLFADGYFSLGGDRGGARKEAAREVLGPMAHLNFHLTWWEGSWLFTHAGLSANQLPRGLTALHGVKRYLDAELRLAMRARREGRPHWVWGGAVEPGATRGVFGCRCDAFRPVRGINQIFGDTRRIGERVVTPESTTCAFDTNSQVEGWASYLLMYPELNTFRDVHLREIGAFSNGD